MPDDFYNRLKDYYDKIGEILRGEAETASIFPNPIDIGNHREAIYAEFLKSNLPSCCAVRKGGFLFDLNGEESRQIDLIIHTDSCIQYRFPQTSDSDKTFSCIDGTIAVVSIKSNLDSRQLNDSLDNIASLPNKQSLEGHVNPMVSIPAYEDWPFKIIYASSGVSIDTLLTTLDNFYQTPTPIPFTKRPNLIHVAGQYAIIRLGPSGGLRRDGVKIPPNSFYSLEGLADGYALAYAIVEIQKIASATRQILYSYTKMIDRIPFGGGNPP